MTTTRPTSIRRPYFFPIVPKKRENKTKTKRKRKRKRKKEGVYTLGKSRRMYRFVVDKRADLIARCFRPKLDEN